MSASTDMRKVRASFRRLATQMRYAVTLNACPTSQRERLQKRAAELLRQAEEFTEEITTAEHHEEAMARAAWRT